MQQTTKKISVILGNILNRRFIRDTKNLSSKQVIMADQAKDLVGKKLTVYVNSDFCKENNINVDEYLSAFAKENKVYPVYI